MLADETLLDRAIGNLLENAAKYSPPHTPITVQVDGRSLSVTGRAHAETIFDRFHRTDSARDTPGSGLGLAIVRQIVREHGGRVYLGNPGTPGARFVLELPPPTI